MLMERRGEHGGTRQGRQQRGSLLALLAGAALAGLPFGSAAAQEAPPSVSAAESLIQLNEGIRAFEEDRLSDAVDILEKLRARDPLNLPCQYHLGLSYLRRGLSEVAVNDNAAARKSFDEASQCFRIIMDTADRTATPLGAALNFGIAKLGSEDPAREDEYKRRLNLNAARVLEKYVAAPPGDKDRYGHFYLGVAYYRLHDAPGEDKRGRLKAARHQFNLAVSFARDVAVSDPQGYERFSATVTYYQALIDIVQGDERGGIEKLQIVKRALPGGLGDSAAKVESDVKEQQVKSEPHIKIPAGVVGPLRLDGSVSVGNYYDNNVILLGHDTDRPLNIPHKYDYKFGVGAGFDVSRQFREGDGIAGKSLTVGIGGSTFHVWQPSIREFDINNYAGSAYVNWEPVLDLFAGVEYSYSYTQLGHKPFISGNRITPVISKQWREDFSNSEDAPVRSRTDLYYSYDYRKYFDELIDPRFDRDGAYHAIGVGQKFWIVRARDLWKSWYAGRGASASDIEKERWVEARIGYVYRNERTQGDEFDLFGNSVAGSIAVPLPWRFIFDFSAEFTWDNYSQPSLFDFRGNERFDFIQRYDFGLTYVWIEKGEDRTLPSLRVRTRAGIELTFQDSNVWDRLSEDIYTYDRAVYGITLLVDF